VAWLAESSEKPLERSIDRERRIIDSASSIIDKFVLSTDSPLKEDTFLLAARKNRDLLAKDIHQWDSECDAAAMELFSLLDRDNDGQLTPKDIKKLHEESEKWAQALEDRVQVRKMCQVMTQIHKEMCLKQRLFLVLKVKF